MVRAMPFDIALRYDPARRRFDAVIERGDAAVDRTLATPMAMAMFCDRRARADDDLPQVGTFLTPSTVNPRRGWVGDAIDGEGRRLGSLLWLLDREKQTDQTRLRAVAYARDALAGVAARAGLVASVEAAWLRRGVLGMVARLGTHDVKLQLAVAA